MAATQCSAALLLVCMTPSWASRPCNLCRPLQVMLQTSLTWNFVSCLCSHLVISSRLLELEARFRSRFCSAVLQEVL